MWQIYGKTRQYRSLPKAKSAAQRGFGRDLVWTAPRHGSDGRLFVVGTTGVESDDRVVIRQVK